jgi:hypothetical protein
MDPSATDAAASCIPTNGGSSPGPIPTDEPAQGSMSGSENRRTALT